MAMKKKPMTKQAAAEPRNRYFLASESAFGFNWTRPTISRVMPIRSEMTKKCSRGNLPQQQ